MRVCVCVGGGGGGGIIFAECIAIFENARYA